MEDTVQRAMSDELVELLDSKIRLRGGFLRISEELRLAQERIKELELREHKNT